MKQLLCWWWLKRRVLDFKKEFRSLKVLEIEGELTCWRFSGHDGGKRRRDDVQQL